MSGTSCNATSVPRYFQFNSTQPHCVFPSDAGSVAIAAECTRNFLAPPPVSLSSPNLGLYIFNDPAYPGCEFLFANVTNGSAVIECWKKDENKRPGGCFGSTGGGTVESNGEQLSAVGKVWTVIFAMSFIVSLSRWIPSA